MFNLVPGLFGDVEYIRFDAGYIGDAFLKLLQGVKVIRRSVIKSTVVKDEAFWDRELAEALSGASPTEKGTL